MLFHGGNFALYLERFACWLPRVKLFGALQTMVAVCQRYSTQFRLDPLRFEAHRRMLYHGCHLHVMDSWRFDVFRRISLHDCQSDCYVKRCFMTLATLSVM